MTDRIDSADSADSPDNPQRSDDGLTAHDVIERFVRGSNWLFTNPQPNCTAVVFGTDATDDASVDTDVEPELALLFWAGHDPSSVAIHFVQRDQLGASTTDELVVTANSWNMVSTLSTAYVLDDDEGPALFLRSTVPAGSGTTSAHVHEQMARAIEEFDGFRRWRLSPAGHLPTGHAVGGAAAHQRIGP